MAPYPTIGVSVILTGGATVTLAGPQPFQPERFQVTNATLRFPEGGSQVIRTQRRKDGVSIDQIVPSSEKYLTTRPGTAKNDHTILNRTYYPPD